MLEHEINRKREEELKQKDFSKFMGGLNSLDRKMNERNKIVN